MNDDLSKNDRNMAMLCHVCGFAGYVFPFGNIIAPLVLWLIKREESAFVDDQGREALNFQISWSIYTVAAALLSILLIGIPILLALWIAHIVLIILAAVRSSEGQHYRYPMTIRFV